VRKGNLVKESKGRVTMRLMTDQGMSPTFNAGDFIVIDPNDTNFDDSAFAISWLRGVEPFVIRRVMLCREGSYQLRGDGVGVKTQYVEPEDVRIIGKVVGLVRKL